MQDKTNVKVTVIKFEKGSRQICELPFGHDEYDVVEVVPRLTYRIDDGRSTFGLRGDCWDDDLETVMGKLSGQVALDCLKEDYYFDSLRDLGVGHIPVIATEDGDFECRYMYDLDESGVRKSDRDACLVELQSIADALYCVSVVVDI